jgi:hypothetical protein
VVFFLIMKDKRPKNERGQRHGMWETYFDNLKLENKGLWINGHSFGLHELHHYDGSLFYKANYIKSESCGYYEHRFAGNITKEYYAR